MAENKPINLAGLSTFKTCMEEEFNSALTITDDKIGAIPIVSGSGTKSIQQKETALASGNYSFAVGFSVSAVGDNSFAIGNHTIAGNTDEVAIGQYNNIHSGTTTFGSSANTICSIGIGTSNASTKNALEIMQNGDIYVSGVGEYTGATIGGDVKTLQTVINTSGPKYVEIVPGLAVYNGLFIFNTNNATGTAQEICDALFESIGQTISYFGDNQKCKYALMNTKMACYGKVYTCFEDVGDANHFAGNFCQDINNTSPSLDGYYINVDFETNWFEIEGH